MQKVAGETPAQRIPKHEELLKDPSLNQDQIDRVKYQLEETKKEAAIDKWVDSNLSNYIKKQLGTPDDPVRALAEQGITHKSNLLNEYPRTAWDQEALIKERKAAGFPEEGMAQSDLAKAWERASDESLPSHRAGDIQEMPEKFTKRDEAERKMIAAREELDKKFLNHIEKQIGLNDKEVASLVRGMTYDEKARLIGDQDLLRTNIDYQATHDPMMSSYIALGRENPWISKVAPETQVYSSYTGDLGFDHIIDILREDLRAGLIRPEQMNKISISDAVRRTHQYDQYMAKKMAESQAKVTEGMPVYKDYGDKGYKWIELANPKTPTGLPEGWTLAPNSSTEKTGLVRAMSPDGVTVLGQDMPDLVKNVYRRHPDAPGNPRKQLEEALKYEGETMGHCVGGYCPDVLEGRSRIYSLRDAKGEPHVTVETKPIGMTSEQRRYKIGFLAAQLEKEGKTAGDALRQAEKIYPEEYKESIQQIKGKQNRAPKEEYLPYVQDFVKGGQWSEIGDLRNTGLYRKSDFIDEFKPDQLDAVGQGEYLTMDEIKKLREGKNWKPIDTDPDLDINPNALGMKVGGIVHMQKGGKLGALVSVAEAVAKASKKAAGKLEEAMKAQQAPMTSPQGTGLPLMPRTQGMYTPGVKQEDLPRMPKVDKARAEGKQPAYTERMQDLLDSPTARKKVDKLINQGKDLNVQEWYGTEPLRQVAMDAGLSPDEFKSLIAQLASASQRNPVDQQNKMGSYLHYLSRTGQLPEDAFLLTNKIKRGKQQMPEGTPIELPPSYGSLAQGDIFERGKQIASGDIMGALPPDKKLGTFYRNYLGNLKPVTVDVNAVRGPIIERGDPRWLTSKLVEKDEEGNVIATHFPRKDVAEGRMSLKEAKNRPGFWEAAPSGSEYAGFEDLWQRGAKRHGIEPAEAQALGWYGSADVTALKTKPELYIDNLERMIRRTAEQTGQHPLQVMDDVIKGKGYLYKEGGAVKHEGGLSAATKSCSCDD
jgi:hypothetical protein